MEQGVCGFVHLPSFPICAARQLSDLKAKKPSLRDNKQQLSSVVRAAHARVCSSLLISKRLVAYKVAFKDTHAHTIQAWF